jgi:UDP-N-acetylglucosamine 2-epimerase (non-hydrolysing)
MSVAVVVGTRPEIIKMAPIVFELKRRSIDFDLIHTGQHYDKALSEIFFDQLEVPRPDRFLSIGSGTAAQQTGKAMIAIEKELIDRDPDVVLVQGDTNTVLAGALAGSKSGYPVGHVEAGLRSYDLRMPEEYNRRLADHISAFLFAPTEVNAENLRRESVQGKVFITGNTVIDACNRYAPIAEKRSSVLSDIRFKKFCLATAHRAENVDDERVLRNFVDIFDRCPLPVVFPIHPRTRKLLTRFSLDDRIEKSENVQLIDPQGYFEFLTLMKHSEFIMTDSGGIQEEATAPSINKKIFVLRLSTERPEAVASGHALVVGVEPDRVLREITDYMTRGCPQPTSDCPYGKGDAAQKTVEHLISEVELLRKNTEKWE